MSKETLLSDAELERELHDIVGSITLTAPGVDLNAIVVGKRKIEMNLFRLINTQKRLAVDSVIGEDEFTTEPPDEWRSDAGIRNKLRAQQRARIDSIPVKSHKVRVQQMEVPKAAKDIDLEED